MDEKEILIRLETILKNVTLSKDDEVEVANFLEDLGKNIDKKNKEKNKPKSIPKVEITNFPEFPTPPSDVSIKNLSEIEKTEEVKVLNLEDIKFPQYPQFPDSMQIKKPAWLPLAFAPLKPIKDTLDQISAKLDKLDSLKPKDFPQINIPKYPDIKIPPFPDEINIKWPKKATEPIPVRLSNGKVFIEQLTQWVNAGGSGGTPKVQSTSNPSITAVPVVNPDGSNISGGGSSGGLTDTQLRASAVPVSLASLPIPTGASTSAKQDAGNTSLSSIDTKTPSLGQALAAASVPVVLTAAQLTTLTPLSSVAVTQSTTPWVVGGNVAAGATDSGNPVKVGGKYNSSAPVLVDGQRGDLQLDVNSNLKVTLASLIRGEDATNNVLGIVHKPMAISDYSPSLYAPLTQVTKANIKGTPGNVFSIYISNDNAAVRYFQLHNKATAPVATEVPLYSLKVPAGTANNPGTLILDNAFFTLAGKYFSLGIGWAISTTFGTFTDGGTNTEHIVGVHYI